MRIKRDLGKEMMVERVVECFADMGAPPHVLKQERKKLSNDISYLMDWEKSIMFVQESRFKRLKRIIKVRLS